MRIPQETILAIQETAQVEEVLGDFLTLQRKGKKYLCPFHQDSHPSLSITADGKFFKCFSCGAKGNAIGYLMEQQAMTYPQAMHYLAQRYHIPWEVRAQSAEAHAKAKAQEALYLLLQKAHDYYAGNLAKEVSEVGANYLTRRALADPALCQKFGVGYSLPAWQGFYDFARAMGYDETLLEEAGLILFQVDERGKRRPRDRFRGRLIFSLYNDAGRVIGFAGRHLGSAESHAPKYINSPETPLYQKSKVLYGLYQAKQAIRTQGHCYLVEGYTDVLAMHQASLENVVASGGTALTIPQITLLRRFTRHVTLLFDGDSAGQQAALRGIDLLLAQGCQVKVVCLPPGEDPDSLRRTQGAEALQAYLTAHLQDFIAFKANLLLQAAGSDPSQQAEAIQALLTSIAAMPDPLQRALYIQSCSDLLRLSKALLQGKLDELLAKQKPTSAPPLRRQRPKTSAAPHPTDLLERRILYYLLHYAMHAMDAEKRLADYLFEALPDLLFSNITHQALWDQFRAQWQSEGPLTGEAFLSTQGAELEAVGRQLMERAKLPSQQWERKHGLLFPREEENLPTYLKREVQRLQRAQIAQPMEQNQQYLEQATTPEEEAKYFAELTHLAKRQGELAKSLGTTLFPH